MATIKCPDCGGTCVPTRDVMCFPNDEWRIFCECEDCGCEAYVRFDLMDVTLTDMGQGRVTLGAADYHAAHGSLYDRPDFDERIRPVVEKTLLTCTHLPALPRFATTCHTGIAEGRLDVRWSLD